MTGPARSLPDRTAQPGKGHPLQRPADRPPTPAIAAWVRTQRRAARLTQAELGAAVGASPSYIGQIETSARRPRPAVVQAIAAHVGTLPPWLGREAACAPPAP